MSKNLCNSSSDVWADCLEFCKSSSVVWANCSELCFCLACLSLNWLSLRVKHLALEGKFSTELKSFCSVTFSFIYICRVLKM